MSAQTLETIPEETPTQVPAPTTTPGRVTSDVPKTKPATEKNPGRVASGKRLAERNRMAREAKKKPRQAIPLQPQQQLSPVMPQPQIATTQFILFLGLPA